MYELILVDIAVQNLTQSVLPPETSESGYPAAIGFET